MSTVIEPVLNGLSIDEWLVSTEEVRQKLFAYARSERPSIKTPPFRTSPRPALSGTTPPGISPKRPPRRLSP
jgi:hypothetical protein